MTKLVRILAACAMAALTVGPVGAATVHHALTVAADATNGSVTGKITESGGSPVANATVKLTGPSTVTATTDAMGNFSESSVTPGIYSVQVSKAGYNTATISDFAVIAGTAGTLNVTLTAVTFTNIREIGRVTARGLTTFNSSTASVAVISAQTYQDQAQTQVMRILDQTPGIVTGHPNGTGNAASPGAITFANIRGGLSFETASLFDGHPLSVGRFGDYVTTFLDSSILGSTEIVKGPGAYAPTINYAIGGTVNFVTLNPTRTQTGQLKLGFDSYGGIEDNIRYSNTFFNRLGVLFDYALTDTPGPLSNFPTYATLPCNTFGEPGAFITGTNSSGGAVSGYLKAAPIVAAPNTSAFGCSAAGPPAGYTGKFPINNAQNSPTSLNYTPLVACCYNINDGYKNRTELAKLRYDFSTATQLTLGYIGSQTDVDQDGNTLSLQDSTFAPCYTVMCNAVGTGATYPGAPGLVNGGRYLVNFTNDRPPTHEVNNEPIFEGELRTTWGKDTLLARYYSASINRLLTNGLNSAADNFVIGRQLFGVACIVPTISTSCSAGTMQVFTGQQALITECGVNPNPADKCFNGFGQYFAQNEEDKLHGFSFQWQHPIGPNLLTFGYDSVNSRTRYTSGGFNGTTINIPDGSGQVQQTFLVRGTVNTGKASITLSNYFNSYKTHYATFRATTLIGPMGSPTCAPSVPPGAPCYTFTDLNNTHWDPRLGIQWQASPNLSLRASAGSAIAPPYINLYTVTPTIFYNGGPSATGSASGSALSNPNLVPETAFGYDLGFDYRFKKDPATILSVDGYMENLYNQFISALSTGICNNLTPNVSPVPCPAAGVPLYLSQNQNLANARYQGLEFSLRRNPLLGLGYAANLSLIKAYPYNLPPGFYATATNPFGTNLGVLPNINYQAGGSGFNSVSNQSIPYGTAYGELNYRFANGMYATVGTTYYGKNSSWNVMPFFLVNATIRGNLGNRYGDLNWQISGDNLSNALTNPYITVYDGVPDVLANQRIGLTNANGFGPRRFRFQIYKNFGP